MRRQLKIQHYALHLEIPFDFPSERRLITLLNPPAKNAAKMAAFQLSELLFFLLVFALLICNAAAGLASGLARGLALTAAAVLCAFAQVLGFQSLDLHIGYLPIKIFSIV